MMSPVFSGNVVTYITSYLRHYVDKSITYESTVWINAVTVSSQGLFMILGGLLETRIGAKFTVFLGCTILSCGIILTYFTIQFSLFSVILTYGLLSGFGIAIAYAIPLSCGMQWFPHNKGLVNGLIVAGFGLGSLGSSSFQTLYLNPFNKNPEKDGYFHDEDILNKVPSLFCVLGGIFLSLQIIGCVLFQVSKDVKNENEFESENLLTSFEEDFSGAEYSDCIKRKSLSPKEVLRTREFYYFWCIFTLNTFAIGYINSTYKSFGQTFIQNDFFLSFIISIAAVFNAGGRIAWGRFIDKFSFKVSMLTLTFLLTFLFGTMSFTKFFGSIFYALWIWLIFFTFSGTFVLMPTVTEKAFGKLFYSANYGLIFTGSVVSGPLYAFANHQLLQYIGYSGCFVFVSLITTLSILCSYALPVNL